MAASHLLSLFAYSFTCSLIPQVTLAESLTGFVRPITLLDGRTVHYRPVEGEVISPGTVRRLKVKFQSRSSLLASNRFSIAPKMAFFRASTYAQTSLLILALPDLPLQLKIYPNVSLR